METDSYEAPRPNAIPVCERCRRRKQKCTSELNPCPSCVEAGVTCMISDPGSQKSVPRLYILQLEEHRDRLLRSLSLKRSSSSRRAYQDTEAQENSQSHFLASTGRYLGSSSNITFVKSAILYAQQNGILQGPERVYSVQEQIDSSSTLLENLLPSPPRPTTPPRHQLEQLYPSFSNLQWQYRILERNEFDRCLSVFYEGQPGTSPTSAVVVYMVLATTLYSSAKTRGDSLSLNAAEAFYEEAVALLIPTLAENSLETLQAVLLILFCSTVNPQKPLVWHLLGRTWRLALALRLHEEDGCAKLESLLPEESKTLPRRLFWALYAMDRVVGNTLGRPGMVDDSSISTALPTISLSDGSSSNLELAAAVHFYRLRQLYSEAANILYHNPQAPTSARAEDFRQRLDQWRTNTLLIAYEQQIEDWFEHSYHNLSMFVYRPSAAKPDPSFDDLSRCFYGATQALRLYYTLFRGDGIDSTWIASYWLFVAAITHLFCLWSSPQLRSLTDWNEVNDTIQDTTMVLAAMTERWRSAKRTLAVYRRLSRGTMRKYALIASQERVDEPLQSFPDPILLPSTIDALMDDFTVEFGLDNSYHA